MILLFPCAPVGDVNLLVWWVLGTRELLMSQTFNAIMCQSVKSVIVKFEYIFD